MSEEEKQLSNTQLVLLWIKEGILCGLRSLAWALVFVICVALGVMATYWVANTNCPDPVNPSDPVVCIFTDKSLWFSGQ